MTRSNWSASDARNRFSEMLTAARREPQTVTRYGKPAAVIVEAAEFEQLKKRAHGRWPSLADLLLTVPKGCSEDVEQVAFDLREFDL